MRKRNIRKIFIDQSGYAGLLEDVCEKNGYNPLSVAYHKKVGHLTPITVDFEVKDVETKELLFKGSAKECAEHFGVATYSIYRACSDHTRLLWKYKVERGIANG